MSFGRLFVKIEYKDGYVKKSDIFKALEGVEKEEDCEYGDYGSVLSKSYTCDYGEVCDAIDSVEIENVQPVVHARWINITNKNGTVIALRCSSCEQSPKYAIKSDWCPNCGARMDL